MSCPFEIHEIIEFVAVEPKLSLIQLLKTIKSLSLLICKIKVYEIGH